MFISFQTTWNTKGDIFKNEHAALFHIIKSDHRLPNFTKYSIQFVHYISSLLMSIFV